MSGIKVPNCRHCPFFHINFIERHEVTAIFKLKCLCPETTQEWADPLKFEGFLDVYKEDERPYNCPLPLLIGSGSE